MLPVNCGSHADYNHLSPHIHPLKAKVKKLKTKGTKASSIEKVTDKKY